MGTPTKPERGTLFCGLLYAEEGDFWNALLLLQSAYGEFLFYSPPLPWEFSTYYQKEMGGNLKRRYLFFQDPIELDRLADIKLSTNEMEKKLSEGDKRRVNIDPGYLTEAKVVLASTKDYSHRIYLGKGIFAEVTLIYRNGQFQPHINTYRDYCTKSHQFYFHLARGLIRSHNHTTGQYANSP